MRLSAIAVVDKNWGIGKDNGLLVHLSGDLKYFKEKTLGNIVIMGRATLESLPGGKPLPGRTTIIITRDKALKGDFFTADSIDALFELLDELKGKKPQAIPFVAGGESIYELLMPYTDTLLITKLDKVFDADKYFMDLDKSAEFKLIAEGDINSENDVDYRFCEYRRIEE